MEKLERSRAATDRELTSWECYNIVLKELAEELIALGASKAVKIVAFKLWACHLQSLGIAFLSKEEHKFPALSAGFRNEDVEVLYGISNLRKKLLKNPHNVNLAKRKHSSAKSDALIRSPQTDESKKDEIPELAAAESATTDTPSPAKRRKGIAFRSSARKTLTEMVDQIEEPHDFSPRSKLSTKIKTKIKRLVYDKRSEISGKKCPNAPVTMVTLITILRVALHIIGDKIYLGDILRWICEGRLSVNQPEKFVPSYHHVYFKHDLMRVRREVFQLDIRNFTFNLHIRHLPTPNLFKLTKRYCKELCLPNEFTQIVLKLIADSKVKMEYSNYCFRVYPDYECRVMAFILFVFKFLFSLDDFTEYHLSNFVDAVNESEKLDSTQTIPELFSWRTWMKYMECRNSVLSNYNVSINQISYNDNVCDENVFSNYWEKVKSTNRVGREKIEPQLLSALNDNFRRLSNAMVKEEDIACVDFPASFTPCRSQIEFLIKNHSDILPRRSRGILSQNFSSYSVEYAKNSKWSAELAQRFSFSVELCDPDEFFDLEIYKQPRFALLALSKTTLPRADIPIDVHIQYGTPSEVAEKEAESLNFQRSILKTNCSQHRYTRQRSSVRIPHHPRYWCFHECHKRISIEEFNALTMSKLPSSFLWLLRQCASMLRCNIKELYFELMFVEIMLHNFYGQSVKKRGSVRIKINEW